jgi:hypothetical protein
MIVGMYIGLGKTLERVPKSQLKRKQHKPWFEEKLSMFVEEKKRMVTEFKPE